MNKKNKKEQEAAQNAKNKNAQNQNAQTTTDKGDAGKKTNDDNENPTPPLHVQSSVDQKKSDGLDMNDNRLSKTPDVGNNDPTSVNMIDISIKDEGADYKKAEVKDDVMQFDDLQDKQMSNEKKPPNQKLSIQIDTDEKPDVQQQPNNLFGNQEIVISSAVKGVDNGQTNSQNSQQKLLADQMSSERK